jgi:hypothetical protein
MPRRRLHREFLRWLKLNRARFAIGVQLGRRTDRVLEFSFVGIHPAITGILSTCDVNVNVIFEGNDFDAGHWDTLDTVLPLRTQPRKQPDLSASATLSQLNVADPTDELGLMPRSLP